MTDSIGRKRLYPSVILKQSQSSSQDRHLVVNFGAGDRRLVHRMVLEAFHGPCPPGMVAAHWDDDPRNNAIGNLRWATPSENAYDAVRNGSHHFANKTHCPQGHPYDAANTRVYRGRRYCKSCQNERHRSRRRRARCAAVAA
ncbi:hypothetical protein EB72_24710 [Mycobacterium sp. SWH-M1]|nr:hypothetical protein EB72_24710 [Mycobacterium sp. SWH-M1]